MQVAVAPDTGSGRRHGGEGFPLRRLGNIIDKQLEREINPCQPRNVIQETGVINYTDLISSC